MRVVVVLCGIALGCGRNGPVLPERTANVAPYSDAGTGTTLRLGGAITLDGHRSFDPDGAIEAYQWSVVEATNPVVIASAQSPMASVSIDMAGSYTFSLTVTDDDGVTATSTVMYVVYREALEVSAGPDRAVAWRDTVQLAGSAMSDVAPSPAASWAFVAKPARSAAIVTNANTLSPSFFADAEGTYTLELTVMDGVNTRADSVTVVATAERVVLADSDVIDVDFSLIYSSFVIAADSPPRLRVISTFGGTEETIALPATPLAISIDGNRVAVAFANSFGLANLATMTYDETFAAPVALFDIVADGLAIQCFPVAAGPIQTYDVGVGDFVASTFNVRAGTRARHQPDTRSIYTVDTSATPEDLTHFDTPAATLTFVRDSPYAGEHPIGGELWLSQDGGLILTRAGNVFRATSSAATDMTLVGHLAAIEPAIVDQGAASPSQIATLVTSPSTNTQLRLYDSATLALQEAVPLPDLVVNGVPQRSHGRAAAYDQSGNLFMLLGAQSALALFAVTP